MPGFGIELIIPKSWLE